MPGWSAPSAVRWTRRAEVPPVPGEGRGSAPATPATPVAETHQADIRDETDTTMAHWEFPGSDPIDVFVDLSAGRVAVAAEPVDVTTVELSASSFGWSERPVPDVQVRFGDGR